jgi:formylglycine-generating enzyme required for sulfatase activity
VTGTQGATVVANVGGVSAANVAAGANLANGAVSANTASTLVKRDESGNFSANTITASLVGNVTGNVSGTAANVTGTVAVANGGTGANLATSGGSGQFLKQLSNGAAVTVATISAGEIPVLPANKIPQASTSTDGYLSATDWTTFNNKQASGSYITALTGDVTASGPGSAAATLSTTGVTAGTYAKVRVDAKGRATDGFTLEASDLPPHSASLLTSGTLSPTNGGTGVNASTAANGQLLIGNGTGFTLATLTAGTGVTINNAAGAVTINATASSSTTCPTGYILVPKDDRFSFKDFCVMKYEAKKDSTTGLPVSTAAGTPFVSISWYEAKDVCQRVGAHLVTDGEWMTIARNIEATAINDIDAAAGIQLATGHTDNAPANALAGATEGALTSCTLTSSLADAANASCSLRTDTNIYSGTGQSWSASGYVSGGANKSQMRTHVLSNGNVIWDLSGNVWEWTDMQCTSANWNANAGWLQWDNAGLTDWEKKVAGPSGSLTSTNGVGQYYGCTAAGNALLRGANWDNGSSAGLFAVTLDGAPTTAATSVGLRCALQP